MKKPALILICLMMWMFTITVFSVHSKDVPSVSNIEAKKLTRFIHADLVSTQGKDGFEDSLRSQSHHIPGQVWDDAVKESRLDSEEEDVLEKMLEDNFTPDELSELNKFYGSELSKKLREKMSEIIPNLLMKQWHNQKLFLQRLINSLEAKGQDVSALKKLSERMPDPLGSAQSPGGVRGQTPGMTAK